MTAWVFIYSAAALQAVLLALALWRRPANAQANRVLAAWVALLGLDLAVKAIYWHAPDAAWLRAYRFVGLFPLFYGSFFYLYVRALTRGQGFRIRDLLHFTGFAVLLASNADLIFVDRATAQVLFERLAAGGRITAPWMNIALFAYGLSYVVAALVRVHRYRRALRERRSDADRMSLYWIDAMAGFQIVIWLIALAQWLVKIPGVDYGLLFGAVAAWICVVGWCCLGQPPVVPESIPAAPAAEDTPARDDARFPAVETRLARLMEGPGALYLEPALTIAQVAKRSGYPEYLVSAVINRRFGCCFWEYVNRLRIEAVRVRLADPDDSRSILDIAYASGFTSKSTFNAAFKKQTGDTPSAYRRRESHDALSGD
ncbi:AraC family transcriptional regulator [Luteibacter rhizovicinus]|uniref:AraC family transcriptional regulator n=2 Tax=Luteibacter rhizovicinus TaxID=242606 RepID=A0A4R3YTV8_9GAMM|nr:AraC family transcriptional regulator [Luteibacter rhizovicinus]